LKNGKHIKSNFKISLLAGTALVGGLAFGGRLALRSFKKFKNLPKSAAGSVSGNSKFLEGGFFEEMTKNEALDILNLT
jgi:hypothetical protein